MNDVIVIGGSFAGLAAAAADVEHPLARLKVESALGFEPQRVKLLIQKAPKLDPGIAGLAVPMVVHGRVGGRDCSVAHRSSHH